MRSAFAQTRSRRFSALAWESMPQRRTEREYQKRDTAWSHAKDGPSKTSMLCYVTVVSVYTDEYLLSESQRIRLGHSGQASRCNVPIPGLESKFEGEQPHGPSKYGIHEVAQRRFGGKIPCN